MRGTIRQMTEVLNDQNEQRDPRPIGRFLLGLEEYRGKNDPYTYAKEFAMRPGNFSRFKHTSLKVGSHDEVTVDGRNVELEFEISKYAYIWKIIVFAERHLTEHLSTGYIPHGGERYELHCALPKSHANYYERGVQGRVIRQREFDSEDELQTLQGLIERLIESGES